MKQEWKDHTTEDSQFNDYPFKKVRGVFFSQQGAEKFANAKKGHTVRHFVLEGVYAPNGLRLIS